MIQGIFKGQIREHLIPEQAIYILSLSPTSIKSELQEDFLKLANKIQEQAPEGYTIEVKPLEFIVKKR